MEKSQKNFEDVYVGKINGKKKYAVWHNALNWEGQNSSYYNFGSSFSKLASYLEGAVAHHWTEMNIINGIPDEIRGRTYESIKINKLTKKSFEKLLDEAGLNIGKKSQVMQYYKQISF